MAPPNKLQRRRLMSQIMHAAKKLKREQQERQERHNLRPRHAVVSQSDCHSLTTTWIACEAQSKCKICKAKFKSLHHKQIRVLPSKIHGYGIFLKAPRGIQKETIIIHVEGDTFSDYDEHTNFSYGLTKGFIEPTGRARYVNHSPSPNSRIQKWMEGDQERLAIVAERPIDYCKEITVDYGDTSRSFY